MSLPLAPRRRAILWAAAAAVPALLALAACGQRGPLYLPATPAAAQRATLPQVIRGAAGLPPGRAASAPPAPAPIPPSAPNAPTPPQPVLPDVPDIQ